jgi:dipeptidyl aminopeptidase/acylaminoacyl peptidase
LWSYKRGDAQVKELNVAKWKDQRLFNPHFTTGSDKVRLVRRDRLQRNLEMIEVDIAANTVKSLITETVENANLEPQNAQPRYAKTGGDIIWWSEKSGWGHYYLYDHNGTYKRPLTSGAWRAHDIVQIDTIGGVLWFTGVGRESGENLNFTHLYRVNVDGTALQLMDAGNYLHSASLAPTFRYFVDNYSRVDFPTKSVLRDAMGRVVMDLEEMDVSKLKELGWRPPETFTVKAADGVTELYGNMWKPFDFDSTRRYPIIAHVYPGPQTEGVNHNFNPSGLQQQVAQLGFIVVQLGHRGGTPFRSNAYQSFSYFNLRDYSLADKKAGLEQLAARHPFIDINRVGIWGHSGGGFLTGAAMLLPPYNEFFKVGWSEAGNHDNNVYNQNWSEQYHGLKLVPVRADSGRRRGVAASSGSSPNGNGDAVADDSVRFEIHIPANHELAENLKGRLMIIHGEMDNNVHPVGSIRLANALIKANKRFDFMLLPGIPHGFGPYVGWNNRLLMEYFAEHLLGDYYRQNAEIK